MAVKRLTNLIRADHRPQKISKVWLLSDQLVNSSECCIHGISMLRMGLEWLTSAVILLDVAKICWVFLNAHAWGLLAMN